MLNNSLTIANSLMSNIGNSTRNGSYSIALMAKSGGNISNITVSENKDTKPPLYCPFICGKSHCGSQIKNELYFEFCN